MATRRKPLATQVRHQVNLRDQGKCDRENCEEQRWLDIHHIIPVNQGGQNTLENLRTLCRGHHKLEHLESH
jgi:5-methylcytosine-specific restriction endonuclease McrA